MKMRNLTHLYRMPKTNVVHNVFENQKCETNQ